MKQAYQVDKQADKQAVSLNFKQSDSLKNRLLSFFTPRNSRIIAALLTLVFALYCVVFWLPASVQPPARVTDTKAIMAAQPLAAIDESPWRESQLAKYRKSAQEILSEVLLKQENLENKRVLLWAKDSFEKALDTAESGDLSYRNQEFAQAMAEYSQALEQLTALEQSIEQRFQQVLAEGLAALAASNAPLATERLTLAMYLRPENSQASSAFDRAIVLERVIELVKAGVVEVDEQKYQAAKATFNRALELDNESQLVIEQLAQVNALITEQNFSKAMSLGYSALNQRNYQTAEQYFQQAKQIKPAAKTPQQAILQSQNQALEAKVAALLDKATEATNRESWSQAEQYYQQILTLDKSLIAAQIGGITAKARAALDAQLSQLINRPDRLASQQVLEQALAVQVEAEKIPQPGRVLQQQIATLKQLIVQMSIPVVVTIESDNKTQVSLYRNGVLGRFTAKQLSLMPGEYTLVGTRDGFRDVRQEFVLSPDNNTAKIVIECKEKVTRG